MTFPMMQDVNSAAQRFALAASGQSVDSVWEQKKLQARKRLEKRTESRLSAAPRHEGGLHVSLKKQGRNGSILQLADV